ncbi:cytochrome c oxidase copper chaperone, putative [Leishmania tarentolae]|uniref:Cytochrome c oxidase copper chaperone, putative n=1 Tax=Leishmania tarentolae TaxID=5689 RepID=A0A640KCV4_LEITA|nr:cytochrome c oxidase copper chaperone, putative [Leishmania tarentolae]
MLPPSHRLGVPLERADLLCAEAFLQQTRVEAFDLGLALVHVFEERALVTCTALLGAGATDFAAGCLGRLLLKWRRTTSR